MGDEAMVREFPDAAQRRAVCERQASASSTEPAKAEAAGPLKLVSEPGALTIEAAAADGDGKPRLPRFTMVAYTGGPMRIAGWRYSVVLDLAGLAIPSQSRPIRFGHDATAGVGHTDSIRVTDGTLIATGVVSRDTAAAKEIVASARNGFPWQASIGAQVEQFEFVREKQTVVVNGREFNGPVDVVRKATLGEISFVDLGADANSSASVAASAGQESEIMADRKNETTKPTDKGAGQDTATPEKQEHMNKEVQAQAPTEDAPRAATTGTPGEGSGRAEADAADPDHDRSQSQSASAGADGPPNADLVADMRAQAATETRRIAAVRRICGGKHPEIEAKAIEEGWDETRCELEVLRAARPKAPAAHVPDNAMTGPVLEAACMLTAGLADVEKAYDEKTLEAASKRFRGAIGLQELLLEAAWANGYTGRNFRNSREVLRYAFAQNLQAAFSTVDIGGILSNVSNKFLLEGFFSVERAWRSICAIRNVSDFKTVTSYRLVGTDQYEPVAPGGELKHGTLGEESYANKADTYGLLLSIDRRDIINDDLGANIPAGWELFGQKRFLVGYDGDEYPTVGATGGFKLHGGDGDGAANNHEDHDPATAGTGTGPCLGSGCKGWVDGSFEHTETDNRPPYEVVCWIKRVD